MEREFERLYLESYGLVYNYVRYRMAEEGAVEDGVAEAYLKAARAFGRFDPERSKFSTWVITIAVNCMKSYYRTVQPTSSIEDVSEARFAVEGGQEPALDRDLVRRLMHELTEIERILIIKKYTEGKRNVEIAQELDMNPSTVSTKLAVALSRMRAAFHRIDAIAPSTP